MPLQLKHLAVALHCWNADPWLALADPPAALPFGLAPPWACPPVACPDWLPLPGFGFFFLLALGFWTASTEESSWISPSWFTSEMLA